MGLPRLAAVHLGSKAEGTVLLRRQRDATPEQGGDAPDSKIQSDESEHTVEIDRLWPQAGGARAIKQRVLSSPERPGLCCESEVAEDRDRSRDQEAL